MSRDIDEEELLKEFEKMLGSMDEEEEDDFGHYFPPSFVNYPGIKDLEYPEEDKEKQEEQPPIPKKATCKHEKKKKVWIGNNLKFWVCESCKEDLGDA